MNKIIALLFCSLILSAHADGPVVLSQGGGTTLVGASTLNNGVVVAATTNYFNLSVTPGTQANTNLWPASPFTLQGGIMVGGAVTRVGNVIGNASGPSRIFSLYSQAGIMASNALANTLIIRYAATMDGTTWFSNYCSQTLIPTANTNAITPAWTNVDSGGAAVLCIQDEENTMTVAATNLYIIQNDKTGL